MHNKNELGNCLRARDSQRRRKLSVFDNFTNEERKSNTHVVTHIHYGHDAFFVFDFKEDDSTCNKKVKGNAMVKQQPKIPFFDGDMGSQNTAFFWTTL